MWQLKPMDIKELVGPIDVNFIMDPVGVPAYYGELLSPK
jgi:hypothetical protein